MLEILKGAGIFVYPLGLCSLIGAFIIFERLFALRRSAVIPADLADAIVGGRPVSGGERSVLARIIAFSEQHRHDEEAVKAFGRLEVNRMERGFVFLEMIVGAAPLLGLLGTVVGLVQVFGNISTDTGVPNPAAFTKGIALALTTTVIGLTVAIPCLVGSGYLQRRVETYAVQLESLVERLEANLVRLASGRSADARASEVSGREADVAARV
ncbi:MotA/TolQ/ExbB proton channel family protein [Opitutales bacterium ASA1]|uniref:MotA/TolQ/ExbB proton channel family protein n=1 Tax=Congregicoccus parvus TaxID=3081749 RepID=UPI002B2E507F|nr:MotA/TolQ/ExbB proton channel family protein [Opitutales bacterium ASA1]